MDPVKIENVPENSNLEPVKQVLSEQGKLDWRDLGKGAIVATLTAVLTVILEAVQQSGLAGINWGTVGTVALTAFVGYLLKNWLIEPTATIRTYKKA